MASWPKTFWKALNHALLPSCRSSTNQKNLTYNHEVRKTRQSKSPVNTHRGEGTVAPKARRLLFALACACTYTILDLRGRCSDVPHGAGCSLLTRFRGVPEKGRVRIPATQKCVCSLTTGKKRKRRRHSPAALYANTQLRGEAAAVHARPQSGSTPLACQVPSVDDCATAEHSQSVFRPPRSGPIFSDRVFFC